MQVVEQPKLKPIGPWVKGMIVDYVGITRRRSYDLSARRWHVVQTEPQQERKVEKQIREAEFGAYLPTIVRKVRVIGERYRETERPMLVSYLFAEFDAQREPWGQIMDMRGVLRLFTIDDRPVPMGTLEMQCVREAEERERNRAFRKIPAIVTVEVGNFVRAKSGPFAGFFGFVTEIDPKHGTCTVELSIFARATPVEFEGDQVEVILDKPKGLAPTARLQYRLPRSPR